MNTDRQYTLLGYLNDRQLRIIQLSFIVLLVSGILSLLAAITQKSAYPVLLGRYSANASLMIVATLVFIGLLLLLIARLEWLQSALFPLQWFNRLSLWIRIPAGYALFLIFLYGTMIILLPMPYPTSFLITGLFGVSILVTLFVSMNPIYPRLMIHILVSALIVPIALVEMVLSFIPENINLYYSAASPNLKDYIDVNSGSGEGGFLLPNLDDIMVGEKGPVYIKTNSNGFRNDSEVLYDPPADVFRILYIGDSFVAGFRTDQTEMSGKIMENSLKKWIAHYGGSYRHIEILVCSAREPARYWHYLQEYGLQFNPDLVLVGICLGNDIAESYLAHDGQGGFEITSDQGKSQIKVIPNPSIGFTTPPFNDSYLPDEARDFKTYPLLAESDILSDRLFQSQIGRRVDSYLGSAEGIGSWYGDSWYGNRYSPKPIHTFDAIHGLGIYYTPTLPIVEESFQRFFRILVGIYSLLKTHSIPLTVVLFPQRYQVNDRQWDLTVDQYALNRAGFDLEYPNRRITAFCQENSIMCFDLLPAMREASQKDGKRLYMAHGDMHWNAFGHKIAGEAMASHLGATYFEQH